MNSRPMKLMSIAGGALLCSVLMMTGCNKEEPKPVVDRNKLNQAGDQMKAGAEKAGEAAKDAAHNAGETLNSATSGH
jgi:hypothetical protein